MVRPNRLPYRSAKTPMNRPATGRARKPTAKTANADSKGIRLFSVSDGKNWFAK